MRTAGQYLDQTLIVVAGKGPIKNLPGNVAAMPLSQKDLGNREESLFLLVSLLGSAQRMLTHVQNIKGLNDLQVRTVHYYRCRACQIRIQLFYY